MHWKRVVPAAAAVVVLAGAAVVYEQTIPIHHVERARLSTLVVPAPTGFKAKPASASEVVASSSPFAAVKAAAKRSPNSTGSYSVQWSGSTASSDISSLLVSWLPTGSDAAAVQRQAVSSYLSTGSFKSNGYTLQHRLALPGLVGAAAATFGPPSGKGTERLSVAAVPEGRFEVVAFAQQTGAVKSEATLTSLAKSEAAHLRAAGSGFTLGVTTWPVAASLIFWGVAAALAGLIVLVPMGVGRARRRRRLAREASAKRAVQGRGRKVAKHQAARSR